MYRLIRHKKWLPGAAVLIFLLLVVLLNHPRTTTPPEPEISELPAHFRKLQMFQNSSATSLRLPILLYHYVEYVKDPGDKIRQSLDIIPSTFEKQLWTLTEAGYTFLTPSQIPDILNGKAVLPPKPIILSFDDGYRDFYTDVFPLLKKYHVRAVNYVVAGFIGKPNNLTDLQIQELVRSNLVEIGAHTLDHPNLRGLPLPRVQYEITEGKKRLEKEFSIPVVSFAYPYGSFDAQALRIVKDAGFTTAVTTAPGININQANRFYIYRIRPGYRTGEDLLKFLNQDTFKAF